MKMARSSPALAILGLAVAVALLLLLLKNNPTSSGQDDGGGQWHLARTMVSEDTYQRVQIRSRVRKGGELGFKFTGSLDASVVELLSLARETDAMPQWNQYCSQGGIVRQKGATELWVFADFHFFPMPIPRLFVALHANADDRLDRQGHWHLVGRTEPAGSPAAIDRSALPAKVRQHGEVVVSSLTAKLTPQARAHAAAVGEATPDRTRFDLQVVMQLSTLTFLGPIRHLTPPQWVVNVLANVMLPGLWKCILDTTARLRRDGTSDVLGARIQADPTGLYRKIRRSTGQEDASTRRGADAAATKEPRRR